MAQLRASHEVRVIADGEGDKKQKRKLYDCFVYELAHKGETSCTNCQQTRAIAGFHFPGADRNKTPATNSVLLAGSPQFYGDQPRRLEILKRIANGPTTRLTESELAIGYAARPMNRFAEALADTQLIGGWGGACLPVSNDTVLRVVRRRARPRTEPLNVVGVDDWAFRRNHRYGTIVCDLERRRVVTLLPDREVATVQAWLAGHPAIKIVSRDRGGGYGEAASKALPGVIQVADRWHLMENASAALLIAVRKSMRPIRAMIGATTINPELLTRAERLQYEGYLRREETTAAILNLSKGGAAIKRIVRMTDHSRQLVRHVLRGLHGDVFRTRQSSLDAYLARLDVHWVQGCHNGAELWRRLKLEGFRGSLRVVSGWATRRRRTEKASDQQLQRSLPPEQSRA